MKICLVGYGKMGQDYVRILHQELGVPADALIVVERDLEKVRVLQEQFPQIQAATLDRAVSQRDDVAMIVTANTPEHVAIMQQAVEAGVRKFFVEKPLAMADQVEIASSLLDMPGCEVFVGYLINFSRAVQGLMEVMRTEDWHILEGRGFWGKDRRGDTRPTVGDLEDEATHPLHLLLSLISCRDLIKGIGINAALTYVPYANEGLQMKMHRCDASYPVKPNSTSHLSLSVATDTKIDATLTVHSSFVAFEQERRVDVCLTRDGRGVDAQARMLFDVEGKDVLLIRAKDIRAVNRCEFPASHKLRDQIQAFLDYLRGEEAHPSLTDGHEALHMVRLSRAAMLSSERCRSIVL